MNDQPVVYRVHDATGRLIYIGATKNLAQRLNSHRTQSWWHALVDRIDVEPHPDAASAFAAEAKAIRAERPAFNAAHLRTYRRPWRHLTEEDVRICRAWADRTGLGGLLPLSLRWIAEQPVPAA